MSIIIILAFIGLLVYMSPRIIDFFKEDPVIRILLIFMWGISNILGLWICSVIRQIYLVPETVSDSIFRAGGQIDEAYIWISLSVFILFSIMVFSFYKKRLWERFSLITSLQMILISGIHIFFFFIKHNLSQGNMNIWLAGFGIGIVLLIYNRKQSKADFFNEIRELVTKAF